MENIGDTPESFCGLGCKRGDEMPTIEKVNYEMAEYLQDIKAYIANFKKLPKEEAKRRAKKNLVDAGIIDEQGNLTGFYKA